MQTSPFTENYQQLAWAIITEQCREYHRWYMRAKKHPDNKYYARRVAELRFDLVERSWAQYLKIDIEVVVKEIERKADMGEEIIWKKS